MTNPVDFVIKQLVYDLTSHGGLALLTLGKNDFEAVEGFRTDRFVHQELDLRTGSQHSACESEYNIERALATACAVAKAQLLRADSGFCSQHLFKCSFMPSSRPTWI